MKISDDDFSDAVKAIDRHCGPHLGWGPYVRCLEDEIKNLREIIEVYENTLNIFGNKDNWIAIGHECAEFNPSVSMVPWSIAKEALEKGKK